MSGPPRSNEDYLARLRSLALSRGFEEIHASLYQGEKYCTRTYIVNRSVRASFTTTAQIIAQAEKDKDTHGPTVCIVENISPIHIGTLGSAWKLNPEFFLNHASNPPNDPIALWQQHIFDNDQYSSRYKHESNWGPRNHTDASSESYNTRTYDFIDGNFVYDGIDISDAMQDSAPNYFKRHFFRKRKPWEEEEIMCSNTRISYYRVKEYLYLFLVDAPLCLQNQYSDIPRRIRPTLRLPYATNYEGLLLPQILEEDDKYGTHYSIFESLSRVFTHRWRRYLLTSQGSQAFPALPLCYMLSDSLWMTNLRYLTDEIRRMSFNELRNPDLTINDKLHDRREDLVAFLRSGLDETAANIPKDIRKFWETLQQDREIKLDGQDGTTFDPVQRHEEMREKAQQLETFLMDRFQLLMSSINVQDAKTSIAHGKRVTQLTILASIYIPLSFVTGIFGMNLKEINGSALPVWVFLVVAVCALMATGIGLLGLQIYSRKDSKGEKKPAKKFD